MVGGVCSQKCLLEAEENSLVSISDQAFCDSMAKDSKSLIIDK